MKKKFKTQLLQNVGKYDANSAHDYFYSLADSYFGSNSEYLSSVKALLKYLN